MLKGCFVDVWKCSFNYFKGALWRGMHVCIDIICIDVCMILDRSDQTKHRGPLRLLVCTRQRTHGSGKTLSWQTSAWIIIAPKYGSSSSWVNGLCCGWCFILFVCCCCRCCCCWWWWCCWSGGGDVDIFTNSSHGDCQIKTSVLSVATVWVEAFNTCVRVSLTVMNVCKGHTCLVTLVTEIPVWSHLTLKYLHGQTWHWNTCMVTPDTEIIIRSLYVAQNLVQRDYSKRIPAWLHLTLKSVLHDHTWHSEMTDVIRTSCSVLSAFKKI